MSRDDRLAAALKNVVGALNALGANATVEKGPLQIDASPDDAPRVLEAFEQGKAVTFTVPEPHPRPCERRLRLRPGRQRARARGAGRPKAAPARRSSVAGRDGPDEPADPEPAELGPQLDWRHPLAGKYAHGLVPKGVRD